MAYFLEHPFLGIGEFKGQVVAEEIIKIVSESCNFVANWNSIVDKPGVIRVFGRRVAEREAVEMVLSKVENDTLVEKFVATAKDQCSVTGTTNWKDASSTASKLLNNKALEPQKLTLYKFAPLRMTTNNLKEGYTQGQLCLVKKIPSCTDSVLEVYLSPFGNRECPSNPESFDFLANGWKVIKLQLLEGHVFSTRGMSLRRIQYPVKHFFAATIHKTMGETLPGVITKISKSDKKYALWEKEQVYVLLSRVKHLSHVTFVGCKVETLVAIKNILLIRSQWSNYIDHFLSEVIQKKVFPQVFDLKRTNFVPYTIEIPRHAVGYVYLLISRSVRNCFYIGETTNLRRQLREHNSALSVSFTNAAERRPWAVMCFITGFIDIHERQQCETFWNTEVYRCYFSKSVNPTTKEVFDLGSFVLETMFRSNKELRMVICGRLVT